jgi:catechol 2,3-dioxygenase-like lactoylglutathione lyase family enzyme
MKASDVIPVLRIFNVEKALAFYVDWLGFKVDWKHQFEAGMPYYIQISLNEIKLHLSEHPGDGAPGARVFIECTELRPYHATLSAKNCAYNKPGIETEPWDSISVTITDPFMNRLVFNERIQNVSS